MKFFKCSTILKALTAMVLALLMVFGTVSTSFAVVVEGSGASAAAAEEKEVKYSSFFILGDEMGNTYKTPENKMILSDEGYYYKEIKGDGEEKAFSILPDDKKDSKPVAVDYITEKDAFYSLNDVGSEEKAELRVWLSDDEEAKLCYKAEEDKSMFLLYFPEKSGINTSDKPVIFAASALPTKEQLEGIDPTEAESDDAEEADAPPELVREDTDFAESGATNFTANEVLFVKAGTNSAYRDGAKVKCWFNSSGNSNNDGSAWTSQVGSTDYNYVVVPKAYPRVDIQRFSSDGNSYWNSDGNVTSSARSGNVISSANYGVSWANETYGFKLWGSTNSWGSAIGTFTDAKDGNTKFTYTLSNFQAAATSYDFKVRDTQDNWYGNNTTLSDLTSGAKYDITFETYANNPSYLNITKTQKTFPVTVSAGSHGSVSPDGTVYAGTSANSLGVAVTASPDTGYKFKSWSVTGTASVASSTSASTTLYNSATGTSTATANFEIKTYTITLSESGTTGGSLQVDSAAFTSGSTVTHGSHTFRVDAPLGYKISSISGIGTWSNNNTYATLGSTSITGNKTISVTYVVNNQPTLDAISNVSKTVNDTTFDVTANVSHYADATGTLSATATSGTTSVATVGTPTYSSGTVTIPVTVKGPGSSSITVTLKDGSTTMNSQSFTVSVATPTFSLTGKTIYANDKNVAACTVTDGGTTPSSIAWTTSNSSNVAVNNTNGQLTAKKLNSSATIGATATYACGYTKTATGVTVSVANPTLTIQSSATTGKIGDTATASVKSATNPSLSSSTVASYLWSTSDTSIIGISDTSVASPTLTFKKAGTATIKLKVTYKNNSLYKESATVSITVSDASITFTTTGYTMNVGATYTRTATGSAVGSAATGTISYSSATTAVATVDSSSGLVTALTPGSSVITATYTVTCGGQTTTKTKNYTVTVNTPSITQGNVTIAKGDSKTLSTATTNPSSGITVTFALSGTPNGVTLSGSTVSVAQNSSASTATVVATAKNSGGTTVNTKNITVTIEAPSLTVKDVSTSVANGTVYTTKGTNKTLNVGTNFSDSLTVKSSNTSIATVALSGTTLTITPVAKGTCTISVSTDSSYTPSSAQLRRLFDDEEFAASGAVATQTVTFTANVAEAESGHVVYFTDNAGWGSVVIHAWGADGTAALADHAAMTKIGKNEQSQDVYAYRFTAAQWASVQHIRFLKSSGTSWDADNNQTVTITSFTSNAWYTTDSNTPRNVGTWNCTIQKPQIQASNIQIDMGSTGTMTATVLTSQTPSTFNWSSGTTTVATTANTNTASNVITGVAPGTSTITIKAYAAKPSDWNSIVTNGNADDFVAGTTTATATVVAEDKTLTYRAKYSDNGSTWNNLTSTQGTFTVKKKSDNSNITSGTSLPYDTEIVLTATPASGYAAEGIYWSIDNGTTWTRVETTESGGVLTNNAFKVNNNYLIEARFVKLLKLSAFDSYELKNGTVYFVTAPPKSITVKHTDAAGTATTYTYSYDGTKTKGNPNTGSDASSSGSPANPSGTLPIANGTYGAGNYVQYYSGDEITLTYAAMASSELVKGVFYNDSIEYATSKPSASQFVAHDYAVAHTLYMNSAYYTNEQINGRTFAGVTVDQDAHSVKFTATTDYKNIDIEIATKRKIYFSDYTNAVIHSKNVDDYYYDNEALSVTGDQLTVAAAMSSTQTNKIDNGSSSAASVKPKFYRANADGSKGTALTSTELSTYSLSIAAGTSTSTSSADGTALAISGNMPPFDLYIDLNMQNSYTLKLGSKILADPFVSKTRLAQVATITIKEGNTTKLTAPDNADVTTSTYSVATGTALTLGSAFTGDWDDYYMFVGWYWGTDSAPDYDKGFISDKASISYTPKKGGTIWAVGTRSLFINGSKYITGKSSDWYSESNTQKNLRMEYDTESKRYYWEITDTMFEAAGNNFKTWIESGSATTSYGKYYEGDDHNFYWNDSTNEDKYHGKSFFQIFDQESGNTNKAIWKLITSYSVDTPANGPTYGKIYPQGDSIDWKIETGQGFINFNETDYPGYSSPLRIYYDPNASGNARLSVEATPIYSDVYVSNGFDVGSTLKSDAVTVEPVYNGAVKISGQTGYFNVNASTTYTESDAHEGTVTKYTPQKKSATIRITKKAGGNDKVVAFLVYDIENKTVRAEKNITKGTTSNSKTPYYIDYTLAGEKQVLYIVPIIEEEGATVTINFDATQLNRDQWGDIVTAYAWYKDNAGRALGAYPGQPMIPSDDMSTWTTSFKPTKNSKELEGITFTNYVDGEHSWLGRSGVMGTVSDHTTGTATGGIINVYNHVKSGNNNEYSRTNYKAQTYDYHEPIALYNRYKTEETVNITFQMKDGNSSLISWRHHEFAPENIISGQWGSTLRWEYLTNAKGDQYIDMNGNALGANNKPTATFYVASKGLAVYKNGTLKYVFHGGHDYEMKGYTGTYTAPTGSATQGTYARTALSEWSTDITYTGVSGLSLDYGVEWYVYDAAGNYITTVVSAGIADLSSNNTDTYIAKQLEDMGYAVDGKSVAICYDKPRYMYGDWSITNSADNLNSGPNFDAYRFEGQWVAAATTDTVKVNVEVAMMTDSGEVLAGTNHGGYGDATASLVSGVTFPHAGATAASDGSWAQTAAVDAKLNGIQLDATSQNFIGWYYYDANTDEFTKATYTSNTEFRPNYTNKDVTYYAVYKASAVYKYHYTGREAEKVYSASGEQLTAAEMTNHSIINPASHVNNIKNEVPVGIGVFKKSIDFSPTNYDSWTKTADQNGYILDITGFAVASPSFTLTAYYKSDSSGTVSTIDVSGTYDSKVVNLTAENSGTAVTGLYGKPFLGWYSYDGENIGTLISTQANYGLRLTGDQSIIAVYDEDSHELPTDGWKAEIDENECNKELVSEEAGVYYNDTIIRIRNSSDVKADLPSGAKVGVIVVRDNKTDAEINAFSDAQLTSIANQVASGSTARLKNGCSVTNLSTTTVTQFNRTDLAVRTDYKNSLGSKYTVYAYIYDGSAYHFSAASAVKSYE